MADYESHEYVTTQGYKNCNQEKFSSVYSTYKTITTHKNFSDIYEDLLNVNIFLIIYSLLKGRKNFSFSLI
jgi:hypothetical protein